MPQLCPVIQNYFSGMIFTFLRDKRMLGRIDLLSWFFGVSWHIKITRPSGCKCFFPCSADLSLKFVVNYLWHFIFYGRINFVCSSIQQEKKVKIVGVLIFYQQDKEVHKETTMCGQLLFMIKTGQNGLGQYDIEGQTTWKLILLSSVLCVWLHHFLSKYFGGRLSRSSIL